MNFADWEPVYRAILADFGFDRSADEHARDLLAELIGSDVTFSPSALEREPSTIGIAAPGRSLESKIEEVDEPDFLIAASTAADRLLDAGIGIDRVVTDLDSHPEHVPEFTHDRIPVAVHAHGDNVDLLERVIPDCNCNYLVPTTQAKPRAGVRNFGGFTDGDRAAFLADRLGATELTFVGWDLDDPSVDRLKARKLRWAERLLYWLERRRGENFSLLDDRRDSIAIDEFPLD